jgi:hypothetical protein
MALVTKQLADAHAMRALWETRAIHSRAISTAAQMEDVSRVLAFVLPSIADPLVNLSAAKTIATITVIVRKAFAIAQAITVVQVAPRLFTLPVLLAFVHLCLSQC